MSIRYTTLLATTSLLLASPAFANDGRIERLPDSGSVSLSGTVDSVKNANEFILRDSSGETIDVHSNANLTVKEGQSVNVKGQVQSEFLGLGQEIVAATVSSNSSATAQRAVNNSARQQVANNQADDTRTRQYSNAETSSPSMVDKPNLSARTDTSTNIRGDERASGVTASNNKQPNMVDKPNLSSKLTPTAAYSTESDDTNTAVTKRGTVASVDAAEDRFILRQASGETIDVNSTEASKVSKGDTVIVKGMLSDEAFGMGEEINATSVTVATKR